MKKLIPVFTILCMIFTANAQQGSVNAIIGDISFIEQFGYSPDKTAGESTRIITHLEYVEKQLRAAGTKHLDRKQIVKRKKVLNLLHEYIVNGVFPINYDYPEERRPCFIDKNGNICAVGYLIEKTVGRTAAEEINDLHKYDRIMDMDEKAIEDWAKTYGLTMEECAMIQPTYGPLPGNQTVYAEIKPIYGISSGIIGGGNLAISTVNLINSGKNNPALSYIGMFTGTGQVIMGIANIRKTGINYYDINGGESVVSYKAQNNLSYINIAMGTSTIITSTLNLIMHKKNKDNRNAYNLYSYPVNSSSFTMGLSFTRKI